MTPLGNDNRHSHDEYGRASRNDRSCVGESDNMATTIAVDGHDHVMPCD